MSNINANPNINPNINSNQPSIPTYVYPSIENRVTDQIDTINIVSKRLKITSNLSIVIVGYVLLMVTLVLIVSEIALIYDPNRTSDKKIEKIYGIIVLLGFINIFLIFISKIKKINLNEGPTYGIVFLFTLIQLAILFMNIYLTTLTNLTMTLTRKIIVISSLLAINISIILFMWNFLMSKCFLSN
jgi:hypothetical protein